MNDSPLQDFASGVGYCLGKDARPRPALSTLYSDTDLSDPEEIN